MKEPDGAIAITGPAGRWLPPIIVGVGAALRVWQFAANRSLWHDEAMLAVNVVDRSFAGLLRPLDYHQAAPLGFLLLEKLAVTLFGPSDYGLRLVPLLSSLVALLVMSRLAARVLPGMGLLALSLFAVSERLVYHASEVKQYSSDVMVAVVLTALTIDCLDADARPRSFVALGAAGVLALWLSHPALFVVAGSLAALGLEAAVRADGPRHRRLGWLAAAWGLTFAGVYLVTLRGAAADPVLVDFWRGGFMPATPGPALVWLWSVIVTLVGKAGGLPWLLVSVPLLVVGIPSLARRLPPVGVLLVAPFAAAVAAAALEKYPLGEKLLLFLVPAVYLLIAEGTARARTAVARVGIRAPVPLVALLAITLLALPAAHAGRRLFRPDRGEDIKPVLEYVSRRRSPSDRIYVYYAAMPAFRFYAGRYGLADGVVEGAKSRYEVERYKVDLDRLRSAGRAWIVFAHTCDWCPVDEERYFLAHLDGIGRREDQVRASGASAYLYAF